MTAPACRLYLITPPRIDDPQAFAATLAEALAGGDVACLQIRLKEYGSELVEVADNGAGVSPDNYQALTLKYHTSKISDFGDLQVRL